MSSLFIKRHCYDYYYYYYKHNYSHVKENGQIGHSSYTNMRALYPNTSWEYPYACHVVVSFLFVNLLFYFARSKMINKIKPVQEKSCV